MSTDWGAAGTGTFVPTSHSHPSTSPALDSSTANLPTPYAVCIVGASRGIGAGIATNYAHAGASHLILSSRRVSGLEETATLCRAINPHISILIVPCDITSPNSVQNLATQITSTTGRLDVLAINSGYSGPVVLKLHDTDPQTFVNAANVNYVGTFLCAKFLVPVLRATPAGANTLIAVSSFAAMIVRGPIANAQYCVSKCAQLKLLEHIHEEYSSPSSSSSSSSDAARGLACYAIHPGAVMSEMAEDSAPEEFRQYLTDDAGLCGAMCVWLTRPGEDRRWLSGRLISAKWDVDELEGRKEEIVKGDLLKLKLSL